MSRIYVACLASYNNGRLHGEWIELDGKDVDDVRSAIANMLRRSPFPNVTVDCPVCEGSDAEVADGIGMTCVECNGTGQVPSAEEWAVHDYDGLPSSFGEYPDMDELLTYARMLDEHGEAWAAYVEHVGAHYATAADFSESYMGTYDSPEAWAEEYWEEYGLLERIPEELRPYIDFESYANDAFANGGHRFVMYNGTLYVFWH